MNRILLATAFALGTAPALAAPVTYELDPGHSQVVFTYDHLGFSSTTGMFTGFEGTILFDEEEPANSSVTVSVPLMSMFTGWEERDQHFMSEEFFGTKEGDLVTFTSTGIEVTGENTALITGDLTIKDTTRSVVLDTVMNANVDAHPMYERPWVGFDATTTLLRSDFGVDMFAPFVSDEVVLRISIEAGKPE